MNDPGGVPLPERHSKSVQYELFAQMGFHSPADYAPAPGINDDGQIQCAGPRRDIRNTCTAYGASLSATQRRFGSAAVKSHSTRSGAGRAPARRMVVRGRSQSPSHHDAVCT